MSVGASEMLHGRSFTRAAHDDTTNIDRTCTQRWLAAASASIRMTDEDELQEAEDMDDQAAHESGEEYLVDDMEVAELLTMVKLHLLLLMKVMIKLLLAVAIQILF